MKYFLIFIMTLSILPTGCKKEAETEKTEEVVLERKYVKFRASIKEKSDLKKWKHTLLKAEPVDLLSVNEVVIKNKKTEVARVRLTDGETTGYILLRYLADKPVVITDETKVYVQNNKLSRVFTTVPKGTIAFIIDEKMEWSKIFIGRAGKDNKYINDKWIIKNSYSEDQDLLRNARDYERAVEILASKQSKPDDIEDAKKMLQEISEETNLVSTLAKEKLAELESPPEPEKEDIPEEKTEDHSEETAEAVE